jgi:hypothetical protein
VRVDDAPLPDLLVRRVGSCLVLTQSQTERAWVVALCCCQILFLHCMWHRSCSSSFPQPHCSWFRLPSLIHCSTRKACWCSRCCFQGCCFQGCGCCFGHWGCYDSVELLLLFRLLPFTTLVTSQGCKFCFGCWGCYEAVLFVALSCRHKSGSNCGRGDLISFCSFNS